MAKTATPAAGPVTTDWGCPFCEAKDVPAAKRLEHVITEFRAYQQVWGPNGLAVEVDENGWPWFYAPDDPDHDHGATFLQLRQIRISPAAQRKLKPNHKLRRKGVKYDRNKAEAISVVHVRDDNGRLLAEVDAVEGQHRVYIGNEQVPDQFQLVTEVDAETLAEQAKLGFEMDQARDGFQALDTWDALGRQKDELVTNAMAVLSHMKLAIGISNKPNTIAAVGALFRIIGVHVSGPEVYHLKNKQESTRDLQNVLAVVGLMRPEKEGELKKGARSARYSAAMLSAVTRLFEVNDQIEPGRLADRLKNLSPAVWMEYAAKPVGGKSGAEYMREQMAEAYNKGLGLDSPRRIRSK